MNNYDVNFRGGFLIEKPKPHTWRDIKKIIKDRKKIVFEHFNEEGDKFFAIQTCYDKEILTKLSKKWSLNFKFFPEINLKSGLDTYDINSSREIINAQDRVLSRDEAKIYASNLANSPIKQPKYYRWEPFDFIFKTLKALGLNKNECSVELKDGYAIIKSKSKNLIAKASPNDYNGYNFVYILPQKEKYGTEKSPSRFVVFDRFGEEAGEFGILKFDKFKENFYRCLRIDVGRKHTPNEGLVLKELLKEQ